ncbi:MAG: hypothetical protein HWE08_12540 [Alphaproteobacteria bacterium]|nr:hypothetical protein [Alphaproteobacteria bacterium]
MARSGLIDGDFELGLDDDFGGRYGFDWPIDETELADALEQGQTMGEIARRYGVSVSDVADLVDLYDLR